MAPITGPPPAASAAIPTTATAALKRAAPRLTARGGAGGVAVARHVAHAGGAVASDEGVAGAEEDVERGREAAAGHGQRLRAADLPQRCARLRLRAPGGRWMLRGGGRAQASSARPARHVAGELRWC